MDTREISVKNNWKDLNPISKSPNSLVTREIKTPPSFRKYTPRENLNKLKNISPHFNKLIERSNNASDISVTKKFDKMIKSEENLKRKIDKIKQKNKAHLLTNVEAAKPLSIFSNDLRTKTPTSKDIVGKRSDQDFKNPIRLYKKNEISQISKNYSPKQSDIGSSVDIMNPIHSPKVDLSQKLQKLNLNKNYEKRSKSVKPTDKFPALIDKSDFYISITPKNELSNRDIAIKNRKILRKVSPHEYEIDQFLKNDMKISKNMLIAENKIKNIEAEAKENEDKLEKNKSDTFEAIKINEKINELLVLSIKAKMAVLEKTYLSQIDTRPHYL